MAAGLQLAIRVDEPPAEMAVGVAVRVQVGADMGKAPGIAEVTVTVALAALPYPLALLADTVYVVVTVGVTVPVATVLPKNPSELLVLLWDTQP